MNPFIFMMARAFSSRMPIMERYRDHERYVQMILSSPTARVEALVEQYFQELHDRLFQQNGPLFLGSGRKAWTVEEVEVE